VTSAGWKFWDKSRMGDQTDLLWLRAQYSLAASYANLYFCLSHPKLCDEKPDTKVPAEEARTKAKELAASLLLRSSFIVESSGQGDFVDLARVAEPAALILLAMVLKPGETAKADATQARLNGRRDASVRQVEPLSREELMRKLRGEGLSRDNLIEFVQEKGFLGRAGPLPYRARYNLACYYASLGDEATKDSGRKDNYERAMKELAYALEPWRPSLVEWAKRDPALAGLRKGAAAAWNALLARDSGNASTVDRHSQLEGLRAVGAYHKALTELGINTEQELLERARTPSLRRTLAKELKVDVALVERWIRLADIMRIEGIGPRMASLLDAAAVSSLATLAASSPDQLAHLLHDVNVAERLIHAAPAESVVRIWVEEAKAMESRAS
jgi:predicted flap endonuclease-1-like 5' DNA nuclease